MSKLDFDCAMNEMLSSIGSEKCAMPMKKKLGYVVFHSGTDKGTIPFYLTKSRVAFSASIEGAEIFDSAEEAVGVMKELYAKMKDDSPCKNLLGVGRITFDVVDKVFRPDFSEIDGVWKNKELSTVLGEDDGKVPIVYLDGFYKHCLDVFAVPQNKTVRIRCGKGSRTFYEVDCEDGDFIGWIEHLEEKTWYTGELRKVANEYIRHFCEKWGC